MKLIGKEFMAALRALFTFPARILGHPENKITPPKAIGFRATLFPRLWLADWQQVRRVRVNESVHPIAQRLILATRRHEMLNIRYWSGSTPGQIRTITPTMVFQVSGYGPLYVAGYCHLRRQERVFRIDRLELLPDADNAIQITE